MYVCHTEIAPRYALAEMTGPKQPTPKTGRNNPTTIKVETTHPIIGQRDPAARAQIRNNLDLVCANNLVIDINAMVYSADFPKKVNFCVKVQTSKIAISRKPVFRVSDQVRHKRGCTSIEDG